MTAATAEAREVCADQEPFRLRSIQRPGTGSVLRLARWMGDGPLTRARYDPRGTRARTHIGTRKPTVFGSYTMENGDDGK